MRVLFTSAWFPYPADNGIKLRIYNMLRGLASHHQVDLVTFADQPDADAKAPELTALCRTIQVVPLKPYRPNSLRALLGFFSSTPRSIVDTFSSRMSQLIYHTISQESIDVVVASEMTTATYWQAFSGKPALFDDLEIGVFESQIVKAPSSLRRLRHQLTQVKQRHYLSRLLPHFQACTVVSEQERALLRRAVPSYEPIEVIPNCVNLADYLGLRVTPEPGTLIFTGSFRYFANHDAMVWFLEQVYPHIQTQVPDVHLTITGDHANLPLPATDGITLTGFVEDVRPLIAAAWISVVPLRLGGGTRLKILEAMALGTPVIATSKGAEGLDAQPNEHLLIADTPEAFAEAVVRLLKKPELRQRLTDNAYQLIREKYDWAVVMPHFLNLVDRVAHG